MQSIMPQKGNLVLGFYEGIRLHCVSFSYAHTLPLSRDVLFTKSTIYCPARNFQKWSYV